jgi:predicted transcriptional regulator
MSRTRRTRRRVAARGGRDGWEPGARIAARTRRAVDLAIEGWTQHEIAADLHVSQAAVSKMLHRADERALQELTAAVQRQKVRQTQRLERVIREAMRAWAESKGDATRRRQRKSETDGGAPRGAQTVAEVVIDTRHGDPRYLDVIRKALADTRKVWGLDAPQQVDVRDGRRPFDHLSESEILAELARQDGLLHASPRRAPGPVVTPKARRGRTS